MLNVLLLLLKIIGIILAIIIGVVLVLVCIILFVPIGYDIKGSYNNEVSTLKGIGKVNWLFRLIEATIVYQNEKLDIQVRVLWKKMNAQEEKKPKKPKRPKKSKLPKPPPLEVTKEESVESVERQPIKTSQIENQVEKKVANKQTNKGEDKEQKKNKILSWFDKISNTFQKICGKIREIVEKKEEIIGFIKDEVHRRAFSRSKKELIRLWKHVKPKKFIVNTRFGFTDPCTTGQLLAMLSVLYPFLGKDVSIIPEFEESILEGNFHIKGRIFGIHLFIVAWRLFWDKNVRQTVADGQAFIR